MDPTSFLILTKSVTLSIRSLLILRVERGEALGGPPGVGLGRPSGAGAGSYIPVRRNTGHQTSHAELHFLSSHFEFIYFVYRSVYSLIFQHFFKTQMILAEIVGRRLKSVVAAKNVMNGYF